MERCARIHVRGQLVALEEGTCTTMTITEEQEPTIGARVTPTDEGYASLTEDGAVLFTDWVASPIFHISVNGDDAQTVFEVDINGQQLQMPSELFDSVNAMRKWCHARNLSWNGTQNQLEGLRFLIARTGVPWREGITAVGLHAERVDRVLDGSFILPNGDVIGDSERYVYVEPPTKIEWQCELEPGDWDPSALILLARLRSSKIMTPIMGWLAAAPLRSLFGRFPVLAVFGASGWGKSTTVGEAMRIFGYHHGTPPSLGGATPHTLRAMMAGSNGIPVWFDEYRANTCRADTMEAFEQVIRKAWDGGTVSTGGGAGNWAELISWPCSAPLVVSGETAFTEVSHKERSVIVSIIGPPVPSETDTYLQLQEQVSGTYLHDPAGMGRDYFEWLRNHETWMNGQHHKFSLNDLQIPNLSGREEHGRAVAAWGYGLLQAFLADWCEDNFGDRYEFELPDYDDSWVIEDAIEDARSNPYLDAINAGYGAEGSNGRPLVMDLGEYTYVNVAQLTAWVNNRNNIDIRLPGNSKAFGNYLRDEFGAERGDWNRTVRECWRVPIEWKGEK